MFEWCTRSQYNVKAITEKPSNVFARAERYHKRCIYCNSKWLFSHSPFTVVQFLWPTISSYSNMSRSVFMSHGFISRFYYRVRLFNALYIKYMSAVVLFFSLLKKSFISWLFLILCINFTAAQNFGFVPWFFFFAIQHTLFVPYSVCSMEIYTDPQKRMRTLSGLSSETWYLDIN